MLRWLPENIATYGADIDGVIRLIYYIVGIWFLIALGTLLFFSIWYRKKEGVRAAYVPAHKLRTIAFVLVPTVMVLGFDLMIDFASTPVWSHIKEDLPAADVVVRVHGKQFAWIFTHAGPDGTFDTGDDIEFENHMFVPVNKVVHFEMTSEDVIHSFFAPNLRVKQDVVPGRTITGWFEATKTGEYQIACAELCGLGHSSMRSWLHIMTDAEYASWNNDPDSFFE